MDLGGGNGCALRRGCGWVLCLNLGRLSDFWAYRLLDLRLLIVLRVLLRYGPLFLLGGGGGGLPFLRLADNFFQRLMRFKQFFSSHLVMKTIFLELFLKNITAFFIDII